MRDYVKDFVEPLTDGTGLSYALLLNKDKPLTAKVMVSVSLSHFNIAPTFSSLDFLLTVICSSLPNRVLSVVVHVDFCHSIHRQIYSMLGTSLFDNLSRRSRDQKKRDRFGFVPYPFTKTMTLLRVQLFVIN